MKIPPTLWRSVLTSLFTTVLDFAVLTGAVELAGVNYVLATWIGTVVGSLSNFAINKYWAFKGSPNSLPSQLTRFALVQAGASGLHTLGVWLMTGYGGLPYQVSKLIIAAAVGLGWNYPMNRVLVFSTSREHLPKTAAAAAATATAATATAATTTAATRPSPSPGP
jgi:putative flippase GtrA